MNKNENAPMKNSIGMFDLSRGFLMVAVVMAHSLTQYFKYWEPQYTTAWWYPLLIVIKPIIYGVIPMFFIMSGYGFRKKPVVRCIKERARYLIKPYVFVGVVVSLLAVVKCVLRDGSIKDTLWYQAVPFVFALCPGEVQIGSHYLGSIGPLWFLVVLFFGWILLDIVFQLKSEGARALCLMVLMLVCTRLPFMSFIPYCIVQSLCCALYMYIGYVIKKYNLLFEKLSKQNLILLIVIVCLIMPFGNVEVSQNVWALGSIDFVASAVVGFLFLKLFCACNCLQGKFVGFLKVAGKYSLYILCFHTIEYLVFPWERFSKYFDNHMIAGILVTFVVRSIMIAAGCYLVKLYIESKRQLFRKGRSTCC